MMFHRVVIGIALTMGCVSSFSSPGHSILARPMQSSTTSRFSTMIEKSEISDSVSKENKELTSSSEMPTAWECNEEAECVEVPACNDEECRTTLDVRIHGKWYDLSGECKLWYALL
jgi:hypothetical protein